MCHERIRWRPSVLAVASLLIAACAAPSSTPREDAPVVESEAAGDVELDAIVTGSRAPGFTLETADGRSFSLAETAGQVRLIDFWATWCKPCVEEVPMFRELQSTYGERGFAILAISDEPSGVIREFIEANAVNYTNLIDPGDVAESYGVLALPSAYLVDREGKVVETFQGPKPRRVLESMITELLDAPGAS